ncbi:MAG: tetratricopeptide repeat protein [Anaerolineae bacterium]|nr:tetratricopeptide repeat protein [Anaerolineae bacterium]
MAGNREVYEQALQEGSTHAWEQEWDQAITCYQRALAEFPDDVQALMALGMAYTEVGDLEAALRTFQNTTLIDSENPTLPEQIGQILERQGRKKEAAEAYLQAATCHMNRQAHNLVTKSWQAAVRADPNCVPAHVNLLKSCLAQHKTREALAEYLALAMIYQAQGQTKQALQICEHALKLDPNHLEIRALANRLQGKKVDTSELEDELSLSSAEEEMEEEQPSDKGGSPAESARLKALAVLAETIFDDAPPQTGPLVLKPLSKWEVDGLISKALDAQTRGNIDEAIANYEQTLRAGVIQPAVNFNLGTLYQGQMRFEDAASQFQQSLNAPQYRIGSHFALGECYRALGQTNDALSHFIQVLKIVDLESVGSERADELHKLYQELAHTCAAKDKELSNDFIDSLVNFLSGKGWEDKIVHAREQLDALAQEGPVLSLAEILAAPNSNRILEAIGLAQEYQRNGWGYAAMDELNRAISIAPTFLPVHWQMGESLITMGRVEEAVTKFLTIADVYRVRSDVSQAAAMYERALRLAPMNIAVRTRLIDLLVSHGEIDRALEHYMALSDTYYQMAQLDRARDKYQEALQLAPKGTHERNWALRILHRIGDIDLQRVDWRRAVGIYEQIRKQAPEDEKARLTLMDLYQRLNQPVKAIKELDELIQFYKQSGKTARSIAVLKEELEKQPDSIPLHARLAQAYLDERDVSEALKELDMLGDLQLQSGRQQDAIVTIRTILRLNPPNSDAYRQLLNQLMAGQIPG